jgi:hypothetical protein
MLGNSGVGRGCWIVQRIAGRRLPTAKHLTQPFVFRAFEFHQSGKETCPLAAAGRGLGRR